MNRLVNVYRDGLVYQTDEGFDFTLAGIRHGTWRSLVEARAGIDVELKRQARRSERASAQ